MNQNHNESSLHTQYDSYNFLKKKDNKGCQGCRIIGTSIHCWGGDIKWYSQYIEQSGISSKNYKVSQFGLSIPFINSTYTHEN